MHRSIGSPQRAESPGTGRASVINLRVYLTPVLDIDSLVRSIRALAAANPLILDCRLSLHGGPTPPKHSIRQVGEILTSLRHARFGVAKRVPIVHCFHHLTDDWDEFVPSIAEHNVMDGFLHLCAVVDARDPAPDEIKILACKEMASRHFIPLEILYVVDEVSLYPRLLSMMRKVECLCYKDRLSHWVWLGEAFAKDERWYHQDLIPLLALPRSFQEPPALVPPGMSDLLYCFKKMSTSECPFVIEDEERLVRQMTRLSRCIRSGCCVFNEATGEFEIEAAATGYADLVRFFVQNAEWTRRERPRHSKAPTVRTAMSDFAEL